jgi:hypothetical protein
MDALASFWRAALLFAAGLCCLAAIFLAVALMKIGGDD